MGYTTAFEGRLDFDRELDDKTYETLYKLGTTRRMMRKVKKSEGYGLDGEFYLEEDNLEDNVVDSGNVPPRTQPSLYCQWIPTEDRLHLEWDGGEKFYCYLDWLVYINDKILKPANYRLSGVITWDGECKGDVGTIIAKDGNLTFEPPDRRFARGWYYVLSLPYGHNCTHVVERRLWYCQRCRDENTARIHQELDEYYYDDK